ncbi:hypothetical protein BGX23_007837 [Mortierella sp. AD031]|nr:hypothetical protein BGX23_007837 [Mortierella sp. AD031]
MHKSKTLFLALAPIMVTECLPLILVTAIYELDIIRYLFFGHPTRPVPPSRRKLDSVGFLPVPEKATSWVGTIVAFFCGVVWFFSEFAFDLTLIILAVEPRPGSQPQEQPQQKEEQPQVDGDTPVVEETVVCTEADVKATKAHHQYKDKHNHHHHHYHHRDIYENSEESFGNHRPQQQHQGGRSWRREEDESAYDAGEESDDIVEQQQQLDLQGERSVEYEIKGGVLFAVSATTTTAVVDRNFTFGATTEAEVIEEAVHNSTTTIATVIAAAAGEQTTDLFHVGLLPAQVPERDVDAAEMNADTDVDADVDTEAADEPQSVSSSPLSSTSTSCSDLYSDTEPSYKGQDRAQPKDIFPDDCKTWAQHSVSTKDAEAPTLDDCWTADVHYLHNNSKQQHSGDDQVSAVCAHATCTEQNQDKSWPQWGPCQLSRAVKSVQSIQQRPSTVTTTPTAGRPKLPVYPPLSPLAAEPGEGSVSDEERAKAERKKNLKYAKKKALKAAKKASERASGMPASLSGGEGSHCEDDH